MLPAYWKTVSWSKWMVRTASFAFWKQQKS